MGTFSISADSSPFEDLAVTFTVFTVLLRLISILVFASDRANVPVRSTKKMRSVTPPGRVLGNSSLIKTSAVNA